MDHQLLLVKRPQGEVTADCWRVEKYSPPAANGLQMGQALVRLLALSIDPYHRGRMASAPLNEPLQTAGVGCVVSSLATDLNEGDFVTGYFLFRSTQLIDGSGLRKIVPTERVTLTAFVGAAGIPGATAWCGLIDAEVGRLEAHRPSTVVVSGAAGAVGSMAGQLAKIKGACPRVIGIAGGAEKCRIVKERYGFDECLDYKAIGTEQAMREALKKAAPDGVDLYFDNTGGFVTDAMLDVMNKFGRIVVCGNISSYNCIALTIRGFSVRDYAPDYLGFRQEIIPLIEQGKIQFDETIVHGFESIPEAFDGLFKGRNIGKMVIVL